MPQDSLFDPPDPHHLARPSDPETSHEAAKSLRQVKITETRQRILNLLKASSEGLTDGEIASYLGNVASLSGLRTRRAELVAGGYVVDSGARRQTPAGRRSIVWRAV
jgi:hypothetical protein